MKRIYDQQPELKRLSEFYIIIFLNKLKILENTKKIKIKRLWLRLYGTSEFYMPLIMSPGPGPMYRLNLPLIDLANQIILVLYLFYRIITLRGEIWVHKNRLTQPIFLIEMSVPNQESVFGVSILPLSKIYLLDFGNVETVSYFFHTTPILPKDSTIFLLDFGAVFTVWYFLFCI